MNSTCPLPQEADHELHDPKIAFLQKGLLCNQVGGHLLKVGSSLTPTQLWPHHMSQHLQTPPHSSLPPGLCSSQLSHQESPFLPDEPMFHVQRPIPFSQRSLPNSLQAHQSPFSSHHALYEDLSHPCHSLPRITSHHNSASVCVFSLQVWERLQRSNLVLKSAISQVPSTVTEMEVGTP